MVDEKGLVSLPNGRFRYKEDGTTAWLMDTDRYNVTNYHGTVSGPMATVKYYTYAFSPELQAQIEKTTTSGLFGTQTTETLNGGTYDIGDVSELQLGITPTVASASFPWTVTLNKLGKLFYEEDAPKGMGRLIFVKKSDDTWALKNWCIVNCQFFQ
jgi:hypothetical protein